MDEITTLEFTQEEAEKIFPIRPILRLEYALGEWMREMMWRKVAYRNGEASYCSTSALMGYLIKEQLSAEMYIQIKRVIDNDEPYRIIVT